MRKLIVVIAAIAATQLPPALAVEKDAIERAQVAFAEQIELNCASSTQIEWVAEDAVYQYVLSDINVRLRVEGRDAVAAHLCALSAVAPIAGAENIRYFPTLTREEVFVQYDLVPVDGIGKRRNLLAIIEMRDNQIANFTQLSRSPESLRVLKALSRIN
jgi:hypothetical protein